MIDHLDRRTFLAVGAASAGLAVAPALAQGDAHGRLNALFDEIFEQDLRRNPANATTQALDKGSLAGLRAQLGDESAPGVAAGRAEAAAQLARLEAFDRTGLSDADRLNLDVVIYTKRSQVAPGRFEYGAQAFGPSPYVISQNGGAYQSVPDFLETRHPIETASDADAFNARLKQFAVQLDAQSERLRHDSVLGVIPPDFLIAPTLDQMRKLRVAGADATTVASLRRRAAAKGLDPRYAAEATTIWDGEVLPALDRQRALVESLQPRAGHEAGVSRLPRGRDFYAMALQVTTTVTLSPDEVHRFGLEQAKAISARLDALLKAQGMTKGSVGQRMAALYKDPAQLYPNTDAGKAQAIAYCNQRLDAIRGRLPRLFKRLPPYSFEVRRVPPEREAGAASAFAQGPAMDGSRPGYVYFNLHDSAEWPKFCLATTIYHEGLPGHQLEGGLALSNADLPPIRKTGLFSGYAEGWALYSEQLADEIGMYDDDPYGRFGYLKFQLFRANRCVVDTGLHAMGWSRERAVAYFVDQDGEAPGFASREVDRYCASPGQAASYKLGHSTFTALRDKARATLGARYDVRDFHEAVLATGRVPLDILKANGERWIAARA